MLLETWYKFPTSADCKGISRVIMMQTNFEMFSANITVAPSGIFQTRQLQGLEGIIGSISGYLNQKYLFRTEYGKYFVHKVANSY